MNEPSSSFASRLTPVAASYQVPNLGLLRIAGRDAAKVTNGLCTANVIALPIGGVTEAFFTDDRGRVMVHAMVARDDDGVWIAGQIPEPGRLAAHIDRFIFREDATPRDVTQEWFAALVDGTETCSRLAVAANVEKTALAALGLGHLQIGELAVTVMRLPITDPDARLCFVPAADQDSLKHALASAGFEARASADEFQSRRIANFWPVIGYEITERTLPQELDRDALTISFTKGCYLGQETVARLDALGEVQKKLCLVRLSTAEPAAVGEPLLGDGKEVGKLTSVAPLMIDGTRLALAHMRRGSFAPGSEFRLRNETGTVLHHG